MASKQKTPSEHLQRQRERRNSKGKVAEQKGTAQPLVREGGPQPRASTTGTTGARTLPPTSHTSRVPGSSSSTTRPVSMVKKSKTPLKGPISPPNQGDGKGQPASSSSISHDSKKGLLSKHPDVSQGKNTTSLSSKQTNPIRTQGQATSRNEIKTAAPVYAVHLSQEKSPNPDKTSPSTHVKLEHKSQPPRDKNTFVQPSIEGGGKVRSSLNNSIANAKVVYTKPNSKNPDVNHSLSKSKKLQQNQSKSKVQQGDTVHPSTQGERTEHHSPMHKASQIHPSTEAEQTAEQTAELAISSGLSHQTVDAATVSNTSPPLPKSTMPVEPTFAISVASSQVSLTAQDKEHLLQGQPRARDSQLEEDSGIYLK